MKIWFVRYKNQSLGPYTIQELNNLSITEDDYVWKEGLTDWMQAGSLPELKQLFITKTPPFLFQKKFNSRFGSIVNRSQGNRSYYSLGGRKNNTRQRLFWISIILILSLLTYLIYSNNLSAYISAFESSVQKSSGQVKVELALSEKQNPAQYITARTGHRRNLLGESVVEGSLSNSATIAAFKDIEIKVDFLSKTNTIITTQNFTIYEMINPGATIAFKVKHFVSKDVNNAAVTIINATAVN